MRSWGCEYVKNKDKKKIFVLPYLIPKQIMGYVNLAYIFRNHRNLKLIILLWDDLVSPALLDLDRNIAPIFCFQMERFTAFQMEISFDGGSFQNLIQKSLSSDAPTDVSRTMCSRQRHNVVMIPMPQTTW